jgi:hypothetical protein
MENPHKQKIQPKKYNKGANSDSIQYRLCEIRKLLTNFAGLLMIILHIQGRQKT